MVEYKEGIKHYQSLKEVVDAYQKGNKKLIINTKNVYINLANDGINEVFIQDLDKHLFAGKTIYNGVVLRTNNMSINDLLFNNFDIILGGVKKINPKYIHNDKFWFNQSKENNNVLYRLISTNSRDAKLPFIDE